MIYLANQVGQGAPTRLLTLPDDGPIFGYWLCFIQVVGPNTIYIGTSKTEAGENVVGPLQDGLQYNAANATIPQMFLWKGELWVSASAQNSEFVIVVPGMQKDNLPCPSGEAELSGDC